MFYNLNLAKFFFSKSPFYFWFTVSVFYVVDAYLCFLIEWLFGSFMLCVLISFERGFVRLDNCTHDCKLHKHDGILFWWTCFMGYDLWFVVARWKSCGKLWNGKVKSSSLLFKHYCRPGSPGQPLNRYLNFEPFHQ